MDPKNYLRNLFQQAMDACSPSQAIEKVVRLDGKTLTINDHSSGIKNTPIYILAVGKASVPMFESIRGILGESISGSLVITSDEEKAKSCSADTVIVGSHPVPDENSLKAGKSAVNFLKEIPGESLVITLISGGTSSLMCLPAEEISITDLNKTFDLLNNSGGTIYEINTVRKHCSQIKGGQLLEYLNPDVTLIDLVISDVPDDDLSFIGSGPTTADSSTFQDAYHILLEFELWDKVPESIHTHIEKGITGEVPETLKKGKVPLDRHYSYIISSARMFARKAADLASEDGLSSWVADKAYNEDVEQVAVRIADRVLSYDRDTKEDLLFVFYGESTVDVSGSGKGGRNQELALRGAIKIAGDDNLTWLSAGTDGIDGPTDAAGAVVDGQTIKRARKKGLDPQEYLQNNDSYHFHQEIGTLLKTGPTGNNLMDVVFVLNRGTG